MNVKINQKTYKVPELTMEHCVKMEEQGFSIIEAFQKRQMMLVSMGFVCAVADCDREDAEKLLTQHVLGGGNIADIVNAFSKAVAQSDFFKKMLGLDKKKAEEEAEEETQEEETQEATEESKSE